MSVLKQSTMDKAQTTLEKLIDITEKARVECCNENKIEARDKLDKIGAYLRMARAEAGSLKIGEIQTRSGDK